MSIPVFQSFLKLNSLISDVIKYNVQIHVFERKQRLNGAYQYENLNAPLHKNFIFPLAELFRIETFFYRLIDPPTKI